MRFALLAVAAAGLSLTAQSVPERSAITVSAAVSLTDALSAIAKDYVNAGRGNVRFNFAASNTLARQIVGGAPVDLFISADEAQMDVVAKEGLLKDGSRIDLLSNQLAVIVPNDRPRTFTSLKELAGPAFKRIALGDPAAVPAGVYAKQLLEKEGWWAAIQPRVVPTASVRAALAAVESGAADAAIVYRTDARLALRATVAWVVSSEGGPRIVYPAAIIRTSTFQAEAARFLEFLRSADARRTFERFGFTALPMADRRGPEPPGSERAAASEPTRAERGAGVPASARLRQGYGEVSPERSARRRKRVGGSGGAKPPG